LSTSMIVSMRTIFSLKARNKRNTGDVAAVDGGVVVVVGGVVGVGCAGGAEDVAYVAGVGSFIQSVKIS
jgi:hypothetical protein